MVGAGLKFDAPRIVDRREAGAPEVVGLGLHDKTLRQQHGNGTQAHQSPHVLNQRCHGVFFSGAASEYLIARSRFVPRISKAFAPVGTTR